MHHSTSIHHKQQYIMLYTPAEFKSPINLHDKEHVIQIGVTGFNKKINS